MRKRKFYVEVKEPTRVPEEGVGPTGERGDDQGPVVVRGVTRNGGRGPRPCTEKRRTLRTQEERE